MCKQSCCCVPKVPGQCPLQGVLMGIFRPNLNMAPCISCLDSTEEGLGVLDELWVTFDERRGVEAHDDSLWPWALFWSPG